MTNDNIFEQFNEKPIYDFDGLTPSEMHYLLYEEIGDKIITFNNLKDEKDDIPLLKQILIFLIMIYESDGIKLTQAGNIPPKYVKEIYGKNIIQNRDIENRISKLSKETDSESIQVTRIIAELSGFIRKYQGKLILTKKGIDYINGNQKYWLRYIFNIFGRKFNLSYFDGHQNEHIGQLGCGYSLYLLLKYGKTEEHFDFYAEKYFKAFPKIISQEEDFNNSIYAYRTFERFFKYFGFIEFVDYNFFSYKIKKTSLMDKYISK